MPDKKSAIIIGAGIGGIATAAFLAKNGYSVDVYEKNPGPGGRCGQITREGHRFDIGATMLLMPGIYRDVFSSLGISLEEGKDIFPLENLYTIFFDDGSRLEFTTDKDRMRDKLEKIDPGSYAESEKYVREGYEIFQLSLKKLISRNFYNFFQLVNFRNIGLFLKLRVFTSNWKYASKFFRNPHLMMAYTFQNIYVGQSPFDSPALFSMVPAAELLEGSFIAKGGMFGVVQKLLTAAEDDGVRFHFTITVKEIKTAANGVSGVIIEDGSFRKADIVVANADLPYVYRELLPDRRRAKRFERMEYSCSAVCLHWGLDKIYPQLDHHNVFLSDGFKEGLEKIFRDKTIGDTPSFYVHAPVRSDPEAAPAGHDTLSFIIATGHIDPKREQEWSMIKQKAHNYAIERLKKAGLDDIEDHIKFEISFTPETWESACNVERGSVFGSLSHNILQMGWFRPHNRHKKYRNLYFVGGSTHPGNGIPNILMSAKLVSERIISGK